MDGDGAYREAIKGKIGEYIVNTPETYEMFGEESLAQYPGINEAVEIFSGTPRSVRTGQSKGQYSTPVIESSLKYMNKALGVMKEVTVV